MIFWTVPLLSCTNQGTYLPVNESLTPANPLIIYRHFVLILVLEIALSLQADAQSLVDDVVQFTILHTNDFQGQLEIICLPE